MSNKIKGLVKWFNDAKGFGFIEHEKGDVFVHFSAIESSGFKTLKNGESVEYELDAGDKGLHAKKVIRLNPPKDLASQIEIERVPASAAQENAGAYGYDDTAAIDPALAADAAQAKEKNKSS